MLPRSVHVENLSLSLSLFHTHILAPLFLLESVVRLNGVHMCCQINIAINYYCFCCDSQLTTATAAANPLSRAHSHTAWSGFIFSIVKLCQISLLLLLVVSTIHVLAVTRLCPLAAATTTTTSMACVRR